MPITAFNKAIEQYARGAEVWGIYGYLDKANGDVLYIGIDRHINKGDRHKDHIKPSKASKKAPRWQLINEYLVEHPNTWEYIVLVPLIVPNAKLAQAIETELINTFKPKLNSKMRD